jgi:hypothetical protein
VTQELRAAVGPLLTHRNIHCWSIAMMDVVMVALAFAFFAVSIAYVYVCDQL